MKIDEIMVTEARQGALRWLKRYLPTWPEYVLKDWIYNLFRREFDRDEPPPQDQLDMLLLGENLYRDTPWTFEPNLHFTMDMWNDWTVDRLRRRWGGKTDPKIGVTRDAERHATQARLASKQGGVSREPVILKRVGDRYELIEGWHRTIQHFKRFPDGYHGPAWIAEDY